MVRYLGPMKAQRTYSVLARVPQQLVALREITANVGWINQPQVRALFRAVDSTLANIDGFDPIGVLARVPQARLNALASDDGFVEYANATLEGLRSAQHNPRWFTNRSVDAPLQRVAYISAEFGLAASVPQYSGGLGVLAGDHLKAAAELGVPLVAVGLFYRHGYFRQQLDRASRQVEQFPSLLPAAMAMQRVDDLHIEVDLGGAAVHAAIWQVSVDTVPLYLLDTDVDSNDAPDQLVTDRLYGGGSEQRIRQEILLGVGGLRALRALGEAPEVFHLNEGHAGFLALELIREMMHEHHLSYDEAVEAVRPRIAFTTHTPVPAGIDRFPRDLMEKYLGWWCRDTGRSIDQLMELGSEAGSDLSIFNLAAMSLRLAGWANGVAQLHGAVSREMFGPLWPGVAIDEVPITSVTNGVHASTWVDDGLAELFRDVVGDDWAAASETQWQAFATADPTRLWDARNAARDRLVALTRKRLRTAVARRRGESSATSWCDSVLDPTALTIGFARRFATYKRATLLLRDFDRFRRLVTNGQHPVQFIFAGKAHPADEPGKEFLRVIAALADDPELRARVVFLEDYDIDAGRALTQGCDVWLNTPLRPMEACGTSGMKSAFNGGLNCSVLDGWWDEWYTSDRGWAIPSADWIDDAEARDTAESDWLFDLFEQDVVPLFYERDQRGVPSKWVERIIASLAGIAPLVSADRMVREYVERAYEPAARRQRALAHNNHERARALAHARSRISAAWHELRILHVDASEQDHARGDDLRVTVTAHLGTLTTDDVIIEVVHGAVDVAGELMHANPIPLTAESGSNDDGSRRWSGVIPCDQAGSFGYAIRAVPHHQDLAAWLDLRLVTWSE